MHCAAVAGEVGELQQSKNEPVEIITSVKRTIPGLSCPTGDDYRVLVFWIRPGREESTLDPATDDRWWPRQPDSGRLPCRHPGRKALGDGSMSAVNLP